MKKIIITLSALFVALLTYAQTIESKITGNWFCAEMDKSTINIYKATDGYWYAKIIKSVDSKKIGKMILSKVKFNTGNNNYTGTLTPPTNSMEINATVTFTEDGKLKLVEKKLFITKTYLFQKSL